MRTETTTRTLYAYSELSADAQSRARDWYRSCSDGDTYWSESVTEDFATVAKTLGFTTGGQNPNRRPVGSGIYWSGFASQGDGACFEGSWYASDCKPDAIADRPAEYTDAGGKVHARKGNAELVGIARRLMAWTAAHPGSSASLTHRGHYYHEMSVSIDVSLSDDDESSDNNNGDDDDTFREIARDLMRYLYRSLEREYEYQTSDECVEESIEANGYEFTEDGNHA